MSYHIFQKETVNLCGKKSKSKSQNKKERHEHCTIFHCIALLHTKPAFTAFQDNSCMHLHPKKKIMFILNA